jgi:hypothetical protein
VTAYDPPRRRFIPVPPGRDQAASEPELGRNLAAFEAAALTALGVALLGDALEAEIHRRHRAPGQVQMRARELAIENAEGARRGAAPGVPANSSLGWDACGMLASTLLPRLSVHQCR